MQVIEKENYNIIIFSTVDQEVLDTVKSQEENSTNFVLLPMHGTTDERLPSDKFLVKNYSNSFMNHMMWEGLLLTSEQNEYIISCAEKFINTGKQMIIEEYSFQEDEPFYDYSK